MVVLWVGENVMRIWGVGVKFIWFHYGAEGGVWCRVLLLPDVQLFTELYYSTLGEKEWVHTT
jgi:hypothetical protein